MPVFVRFGLFVLCLIGIFVGISLLLGDAGVLDICGKGCGISSGLVSMFGSGLARVILSIFWFAVAGFFGFVAIWKN